MGWYQHNIFASLGWEQAQKKSSANSPWWGSTQHTAKLSPALNFLAWRAVKGVGKSQMQSLNSWDCWSK